MKILISIFLLALTFSVHSQDMKKFSLYKPAEDAEKEIEIAVKKAKSENKYVFVQIGGNWCIWCARFHEYVTRDKQLDSLLNSNYVVYQMNYSKENYNAKLLTKFNFPQRFGFPVFLILDGGGKLLHTQNSWYLEDGESYNREKVVSFFNEWSPKVFDPKLYNEQRP